MGILIAASPGYSRAGPPRCILGLHPGNVLQDIPVGENSAVAQTFGNQFFRVHGNYPATDFRIPGWIHPPKAWWRDLTLYILAHFEEDLERLGLYEPVRATCYGIQMSVANFYAIFELYCPATGTFFTLVGELGMTLHEMWEVSICQWVFSPMKNTSHVRQIWCFWRSRSPPCLRHIES